MESPVRGGGRRERRGRSRDRVGREPAPTRRAPPGRGRQPPPRSPLRFARSALATASPSLPARAGGGACAPGAPSPGGAALSRGRASPPPRPAARLLDPSLSPERRGGGVLRCTTPHHPGSWGAQTPPPYLPPVGGSPAGHSPGVSLSSLCFRVRAALSGVSVRPALSGPTKIIEHSLS